MRQLDHAMVKQRGAAPSAASSQRKQLEDAVRAQVLDSDAARTLRSKVQGATAARAWQQQVREKQARQAAEEARDHALDQHMLGSAHASIMRDNVRAQAKAEQMRRDAAELCELRDAARQSAVLAREAELAAGDQMRKAWMAEEAKSRERAAAAAERARQHTLEVRKFNEAVQLRRAAAAAASAKEDEEIVRQQQASLLQEARAREAAKAAALAADWQWKLDIDAALQASLNVAAADGMREREFIEAQEMCLRAKEQAKHDARASARLDMLAANRALSERKRAAAAAEQRAEARQVMLNRAAFVRSVQDDEAKAAQRRAATLANAAEVKAQRASRQAGAADAKLQPFRDRQRILLEAAAADRVFAGLQASTVASLRSEPGMTSSILRGTQAVRFTG